MSSKVQAAKRVSMAGIPTVVANGKRRQILGQIFDGKEVGTLFLPQEQRIPTRKHWIAFTITPRGKIVIDDGAKKVILHNGKSLLPSGILEVRGKFGVGSAVQCLDRDGLKVGMGLVNYSSSDIEKIKGHKTSEIEGILGYKYHDEVIHRDNLAVFA
jgi:glutamate 5-kinase